MSRIIYLIPLLILFGCQKAEDRTCFKGSGSTVVESRSFAPFERIELYDNIAYNLIQGEANKVEIRCGENLINSVVTDLNDGVLTIRDNNKCHWLRELPISIEVDIYFSQLKHIRNESSGTLTCQNRIVAPEFEFHNWHTVSKNYLDFDVDQLTVQLHAGGAYVEVQGQAEMTFFRNSGRGKLLAEELSSYNIWADNKSEGEIRCTINGGTLWYMLDGQGSTYYRGVAQELIEVSRQGAGDLVKLD